MNSNNPEIDFTDFFERVSELWATGMTQSKVAQSMNKPLSTVRSRLRYHGYKFDRNGRIVPIVGSMQSVNAA